MAASLTLVVAMCATVLALLTAPAAFAGTTTTTTLTTSVNPSLAGTSASLTADVVSTSAPTGSVDFYDTGSYLNSVNLTFVNGTKAHATYVTGLLTAGSHSLTAIYNPTGVFDTSTSPALNQIVTRIPTTTVITPSQNPASVIGGVTLTATVSPAPSPAGELVYFYNGQSYIGTGTLNAAGTATRVAGGLVPGNAAFQAQFFGSSTPNDARPARARSTSRSPTPPRS